MLQELLPLMPSQSGGVVLVATLILGGLAGLVFWFAGARYGRMIITLFMVAAGGAFGMLGPRLFAWDINSMAAAVGAAMIAGLAAFLMHRFFAGIGLGIVLALWAALGTWLVCHGNKPLAWPTGAENLNAFAKALWDALPDEVKSPLPVATGAAMFFGMMTALLWPRLGTVLMFSTTGVTLLTAMGLWAIQSRTVQWPSFLPAKTDAQIVLLSGMVVLGVMVQWHWLPMKRKVSPAPQSAAS